MEQSCNSLLQGPARSVQCALALERGAGSGLLGMPMGWGCNNCMCERKQNRDSTPIMPCCLNFLLLQ